MSTKSSFFGASRPIASALRWPLWALCLALSIPSHAQTTSASPNASGAKDQKLEEVVITAQKRTENLQKTSVAVTAVSGEKINEQGLSDAAAVMQDVPNVVVQGAARGQVLGIRGLGSDLPAGMGESAVSTNFDGVYSFRPESNVTGFYDLGRVEVLRGPQSTLYGRNATGGVVNVISAIPTFDRLGGYTTFELGNYSLRRAETALNMPISGNWAARVAYANINRNGFSSNGGNDAVGWGARTKLLYQDGDKLSVLLNYEENHQGGKGVSNTPQAYWPLGEYYKNDASDKVSQDYKGQKYSAEVNARLGPGTLTFIPSYQHGVGWVCQDMMGFACGWDPKNVEQKATDLRYASLPDSFVQWVAGLYYYNLYEDTDLAGGIIKGSDSTRSLAYYGQLTYPLTQSLRAIAGLRSGEDKKWYVNQALNPPIASHTFQSFDYKVGFEYDVNSSSLAYVTLASGHRPGGFNAFPGARVAIFDQENLVSLEVGSKNRFFGGKAQLNGNVFYYDYKNYQAADFYLPAGSSFPQLFIYNVPKVKNYGLELEGKARIASDTLLSVALTSLSTTYASSFELHDGPFIAEMNGKTLPHAPKATIKIGVEQGYNLAYGSLTGKFDVRHVSDQFVGAFPGEFQTQKAYAQADASLIYRPNDESWSLNLYCRNLTDKVVKTFYAANELVPSAPRMFGATLTLKY